MLHKTLTSFLTTSLFFGVLPGLFAQTMSGVYTIGGSNPDFATINEAVNKLQTSFMNGGVTFQIRPGVYTERVILSNVAGSNNNTNTITFTSETLNPADVVITSNGGGSGNDHHTLLFSTGQFYKFRFLTLENKHASTGSVVHLTNQSGFNEFKYCRFYLDTTIKGGQRYGAVSARIGSMSNAGINAQFSTFEQCSFKGGQAAIYWVGDTDNKNGGNKFLFNQISKSHYGMIIRGQNDLSVIGNHLNLDNDLNTYYAYGINIETSTKIKIDRNYIYGAAERAIHLDQVTGSPNQVSNNILAGGFLFRNSTTYARGIYLYRSDNFLIAHNTVIMDQRYNNHASPFWALSGSTHKVYNNIFMNTQGGKCWYTQGSTDGIGNSDRNVFYSTDSLPFYTASGSQNFSQYKALRGTDVNSRFAEPKFLSETDFHSLDTLLDGNGLALTEVTLDFDGQVRSSTAPDIGADEFELSAFDLSLDSVGPPVLFLGDVGLTARLKNLGTSSLKDSLIRLSWSLDNGNTWADPENYTIKDLKKYGATELFAFSKKSKIDQAGTYTYCIRLEPGSLPSDTVQVNNKKCRTACTGLLGTYKVGGSGADFTHMDSALNALRLCGLAGDVTLQVQPGTYNESWKLHDLTFNNLPSARLIIESITGSASDVRVSSAGGGTQEDHATVSLKNVQNLILQHLTIINTNDSIGSALNMEYNCRNVTIRYCRIMADSLSPSLTLTALRGSGFNYSNYTQNLYNIKISQNFISGGTNGVHLQSYANADSSFTLRIDSNTIRSVLTHGIYLDLMAVRSVSGNHIQYRSGAPANEMGYALLIKRNKGDFWVQGNRIPNPAGQGISLENNPGRAGRVLANNAVGMDFLAQGQGHALKIQGSDSINVWHNTLVHKSNVSLSSAVFIENCKGLDLRNNVLNHKGSGFSFVADSGTSTFKGLDHNVYGSHTDSLIFWNGVLTSLEQFQERLPGFNHFSRQGLLAPSYPSSLLDTSALCDSGAVFIEDVPLDFSGKSRNKSFPDIGCHEYTRGGGDDPGDTTWVTFYGLEHGAWVFPNPVSQNARLVIPDQLTQGCRGSLHLTLLDPLGRVMMERVIELDRFRSNEMDTSGSQPNRSNSLLLFTVGEFERLPQGNYVLSLRDSRSIFAHLRIMK